MIISRYTAFRRCFALEAAPLDDTGLPDWPVANLRINGFDDGIAFNYSDPEYVSKVPVVGFPISVTCNGAAADAVPLTHEYDWYISRRTDEPSKRALRAHTASIYASGTIYLTDNPSGMATLVPGYSSLDLVLEDSLRKIFRHVHIYVQRRSDKSIQWLDVEKLLFPNG